MPGTLSIITNTFPPAERGRAIGTWAGVSRHRARARPAARRLADRGRQLARDLLHQPPGRRGRGRRDAVRHARVARRDRDARGRHPRHRRADRRPDRARARAGRGQRVGLGLGAASSACSRSRSSGWSRSSSIERRSRAPIVDFTFFRSRSFVGANVVAFAISFGMFAVFFFLALYMQNILGYSPLETGVRFLPSTLVIMVAGPLAGRLADRIGPRTPLVIGLLARDGRASPGSRASRSTRASASWSSRSSCSASAWASRCRR